jgi:hypothetical protein
MIAPAAGLGKALPKLSRVPLPRPTSVKSRPPKLSPRGCDTFDQRHHRFVRRIIIRPHFGQSRAKLDCETPRVASRPGLDCVPDSSAPQPPGMRTDRARGSTKFQLLRLLLLVLVVISAWAGRCRPFYFCGSVCCRNRQQSIDIETMEVRKASALVPGISALRRPTS